MVYSEREMFHSTPGYDDLFKAMNVTLAKNGVLAQIKANVMYSVFENLNSGNEEALREKMGNPKRDTFAATDVGKETFSMIHELLEALGMEFSLKMFEAECGLDQHSSTSASAQRVRVEDARLPKLVAAACVQSAPDSKRNGTAQLPTESCSGISASWDGSQAAWDASSRLSELDRSNSPDILQAQPSASDLLAHKPPQEQDLVSRDDSDAVAALLGENIGPVDPSCSDGHERNRVEGNENLTGPFPASSLSCHTHGLDVSDESLSPSPPALDRIGTTSPTATQSHSTQELTGESHAPMEAQPQPSNDQLDDDFRSPPDARSQPNIHQSEVAPKAGPEQKPPHPSGAPRVPTSCCEHEKPTSCEQQESSQSHPRAAVAPSLPFLDYQDDDSVESIPEEIIEENIEGADANNSDDDCFTDIGAFVPLSSSCTMNQADLAAELADLAPPRVHQVARDPGAQPTSSAPTQVSPEGSDGSRADKDLYDILCGDELYDEEFDMGVPSLPGM